MNAVQAIKQSMNVPNMISMGYLEDLTDEELLIRPVEGTNHIAWQLGHLIGSENNMIGAVCPGSMPNLPDGFAEKHTKETAASDNPADFLSKAEYLKMYQEQRAATIAALESLSDDDLDKESPGELKNFLPTVGDVFSMQPSHWLMHAGQWAVLRRKLGREPLF